jgi:signal transduction histidine kinase
MLARALTFLRSLSPALLTASVLGLIAIVGAIDFYTGTDATFSAIYLFPIGTAAWFLSRRIAYVLAVLSAAVMVGGDIAAGARYATVVIPIWNIVIRFTMFAVALTLIADMRKLLDSLERRAAERAVKLTAEIAKRERLERELLHISEREQRRVGHDIHDSLCQHLTGTALAGQVLTECLKSEGSPHAGRAARVVELVEDGIALSRDLAKGLNTVRLSTDGLMEALEDFAASTSDLFRISCRFECPLPVLIEDTDTATHLFRIAQEAVGNAVKHGRAKNIRIRLETTEEGNLLRVIDDGTGIPAQQDGKGMGLRIMSYRADIIGARFDIASNGRQGTTVSCLLPSERALQT